MEEDKTQRGEGNVKTGLETGVIWPQAKEKECQQPPELGKIRERFSLRGSRATPWFQNFSL